jgi:hypothetical protein
LSIDFIDKVGNTLLEVKSVSIACVSVDPVHPFTLVCLCVNSVMLGSPLETPR